MVGTGDTEFGCHGDGNGMETCPEQSRTLRATMETCFIHDPLTSGTQQTARRTAFPNPKLVMAHCIFPEDAV